MLLLGNSFIINTMGSVTQSLHKIAFYYKNHTFYYKKWSLFITKINPVGISFLYPLPHIHFFYPLSASFSFAKSADHGDQSVWRSENVPSAEIVLIMRTDRLCLLYLFTVIRLFIGKHLVEQGMRSLDLFDREAFGSSCSLNSLDSQSFHLDLKPGLYISRGVCGTKFSLR